MMRCVVCGHQNPAAARTCSACGTALDLSATGTPLSGTPGIATGGTGVQGGAGATYTSHLTKGVKLQVNGYAVGEVLGQGGFGITYKGGDLSLRRYVAIKEFFPYGCVRQGNNVVPSGGLSAAEYASIKAKFLEEARTLARFSHPGIVRVFGAFEENNTAYMVMEFLEGQTLSKRMNEQGTMDEAEVVSLAQNVGGALDVVHAAGMIHRDIKPDNICLTPAGRVVLIDFGTARAFASGKTVQQTTQLTPGYAPLEQYGQQARFGVYTDIYALGATLYHALTGQMPPPATDRAAGVELKDPHTLNPRLSSAVSQALVWALQIKAAERPQRVKDFLASLKIGVAATSAATNTQVGTVDPAQMALTPAQLTPAQAAGWNVGPARNAAPVVPVPVPSPGAYPGGTASVQQVAEHQLLTNAAPPDVLAAVQRGFESFGVTNPTVDRAHYRVYGSTGADLRSWAQNVIGQVTQDARGTLITVTSTAAVGMTDYGRGRAETRRLLGIIQSVVVSLPVSAPHAAPPPNLQSQNGYPAPHYGPQGGGYPSPPAQPMIRRQGGNVLAFGIVGLLFCGVFGPVAWITGHNALKEYGNRDPGDRATVQTGQILGIIATIGWGLYYCALFLSR